MHNTAFKDAYSIVITQTMAKALFGNEDPMNKMIRFDNADNLKVTGVLKDIPDNATVDFNFVVPSTYVYQKNPLIKSDDESSFSNNNLANICKVKTGNYMRTGSSKDQEY